MNIDETVPLQMREIAERGAREFTQIQSNPASNMPELDPKRHILASQIEAALEEYLQSLGQIEDEKKSYISMGADIAAVMSGSLIRDAAAAKLRFDQRIAAIRRTYQQTSGAV